MKELVEQIKTAAEALRRRLAGLRPGRDVETTAPPDQVEADEAASDKGHDEPAAQPGAGGQAAPKVPPDLPLFFMLSHLDDDGPCALTG